MPKAKTDVKDSRSSVGWELPFRFVTWHKKAPPLAPNGPRERSRVALSCWRTGLVPRRLRGCRATTEGGATDEASDRMAAILHNLVVAGPTTDEQRAAHSAVPTRNLGDC